VLSGTQAGGVRQLRLGSSAAVAAALKVTLTRYGGLSIRA